ncbi:MAG: peroxidase-related enzyme [Deltaproteobacteria bacterium]|nr:peroxidase-related enzyme [Deltaproteobacteria bacterium]
MPRVSPVDPTEASPEVQAVFAEIREAFGMVPNLFRTQAHVPALLRANWDKVKAVMMGGVLSRKVKEAIAVLVSKDNACPYCVAAHTAALRAVGVPEDEVARILDDPDGAEFSPREKALIRLARQANTDPHRMPDALFATVRAEGASDAEIVEALGVMEVFVAFNRFLDSLQVDVDF